MSAFLFCQLISHQVKLNAHLLCFLSLLLHFGLVLFRGGLELLNLFLEIFYVTVPLGLNVLDSLQQQLHLAVCEMKPANVETH